MKIKLVINKAKFKENLSKSIDLFFGESIEKGIRDTKRLIKKKVLVKRDGKYFFQTVYVSPEGTSEPEVGEEISPNVLNMTVKQYTDKSILLTGSTRDNIEVLRELKSELKIGTYNDKLGGWIFPSKFKEQILAKLWQKAVDKDDNLLADYLQAQKNAYPVGTRIKGKTENGIITAVNEGMPVTYDVKTDSGKEFKNIHENLIQVLPETSNEKISELITTANEENRNNVEILVNGTCEGDEIKTVEQVIETEKYKSESSEVKGFDWNNFTPKEMYLEVAKNNLLKAKIYTDIPLIEFFDVKSKDILSKEKPKFVLDYDDSLFRRNGYNLSAVVRDNNNVLVRLGENNNALMTLDHYVAMEKYLQVYTKESLKNEENKRVEAKKKRLKEDYNYTDEQVDKFVKAKKKLIKINDQSNSTRLDVDFWAVNTGLNYSVNQRQYWNDRERLFELKGQKSVDMTLQLEDIENSFKKGRETSYGNKGATDQLLNTHGVKIKRQNGDEISQNEINQLKEALDSVYSVFGDRSEMSKKWGLKISHSGEKKMHAMKAVGVFFPVYNAIGVSFATDVQGKLTLSHEFAHFMDYWIGKQEGSHFGTDKYGSLIHNIADTFRRNMNKKQDSDYQNRTCECFARAMEQYFAYKTSEVDYKDVQTNDNHVVGSKFEKDIVPLINSFFATYSNLLKSLKTNIVF